jgi:DNA repair exonuclease SbcCD ATPase subunit
MIMKKIAILLAGLQTVSFAMHGARSPEKASTQFGAEFVYNELSPDQKKKCALAYIENAIKQNLEAIKDTTGLKKTLTPNEYQNLLFSEIQETNKRKEPSKNNEKLEKANRNLEKRVEELQKLLSETEAKKEKLENGGLADTICKLREEKKELNNTISTLRNKIYEEIEKPKREQQSNPQRKEETEKMLQEINAIKNSSQKEREAQEERYKQRIEALESTIHSLERKAIKSPQKTEEKSESDIKEYEQKIEQLRKTNTLKNAHIELQKKRIETLENTNNDQKGQLAKAQETIAELAQKIKALEEAPIMKKPEIKPALTKDESYYHTNTLFQNNILQGDIESKKLIEETIEKATQEKILYTPVVGIFKPKWNDNFIRYFYDHQEKKDINRTNVLFLVQTESGEKISVYIHGLFSDSKSLKPRILFHLNKKSVFHQEPWEERKAKIYTHYIQDSYFIVGYREIEIKNGYLEIKINYNGFGPKMFDINDKKTSLPKSEPQNITTMEIYEVCFDKERK